MATALRPTNNPNGRPSNAVLGERLERAHLRAAVLATELVARDAETAALAVELSALSRRVQLAIHAERPDVALHVAGRLDALAESLARRSVA
jgi:hypothetical protein